MDGAFQLASVSVPAHPDIESAQALLRRVRDFFRQKDGACTGTESRFGANESAQPFQKAALFKEVKEGGRFAARDYECVDVVELFRLFYQRNMGPQALQHAPVRVVVALQSQH